MLEINNLTTSSVDEEFLKGVAKKVLKGEDRKEVGLSIVFVGQGKMRKLNKKYRGKNKVTDVLSFDNGLNEIVICLREVKKNAKRYNSTFKKELAQVLIHGILHLLGYEHEKTKKEAEVMENKQSYYLSQI
ncbi:rRNA maturation RNase YbeY [Patescibacteria group bacterium]|nr:rRNA maturation RNase YbeY [Patescibacteria group bacterium]